MASIEAQGIVVEEFRAIQPSGNIRRLRRSAADRTNRGNRRAVGWHAELTTGEAKFPCDVMDISDTGAKLRLPYPLPAGTNRVWLIIDFVGVIPAEPSWRKREFLGLRFLPVPSLARRLERVDQKIESWSERDGPDSAA
jgi:hypothetical protein